MSRVLDWEACRNTRDLGGLPVRGGTTTRHSAVVRSDSLCRLTSAGQAAVVAYGIRTVVDIRFRTEMSREPPHPFGVAGLHGVVYRNVPTINRDDPKDRPDIEALFQAAETRLAMNCLDLDVNRLGYAAILGAIADAQPGGVVFHCKHGKDRTGVVAELLLAAVGVPDEAIAEDYAMSTVYLAWHHAQPGVWDEVEALEAPSAASARTWRPAAPRPHSARLPTCGPNTAATRLTSWTQA